MIDLGVTGSACSLFAVEGCVCAGIAVAVVGAGEAVGQGITIITAFLCLVVVMVFGAIEAGSGLFAAITVVYAVQTIVFGDSRDCFVGKEVVSCFAAVAFVLFSAG